MNQLLIVLLLMGTVTMSFQTGKLGFIWNPGTQKIIKVYPGSPAAIAGLQKGDKVVSPPGCDIRGCVGDEALLGIKRANCCDQETVYIDLEFADPATYRESK